MLQFIILIKLTIMQYCILSTQVRWVVTCTSTLFCISPDLCISPLSLPVSVFCFIEVFLIINFRFLVLQRVQRFILFYTHHLVRASIINVVFTYYLLSFKNLQNLLFLNGFCVYCLKLKNYVFPYLEKTDPLKDIFLKWF